MNVVNIITIVTIAHKIQTNLVKWDKLLFSQCGFFLSCVLQGGFVRIKMENKYVEPKFHYRLRLFYLVKKVILLVNMVNNVHWQVRKVIS